MVDKHFSNKICDLVTYQFTEHSWLLFFQQWNSWDHKNSHFSKTTQKCSHLCCSIDIHSSHFSLALSLHILLNSFFHMHQHSTFSLSHLCSSGLWSSLSTEFLPAKNLFFMSWTDVLRTLILWLFQDKKKVEDPCRKENNSFKLFTKAKIKLFHDYKDFV